MLSLARWLRPEHSRVGRGAYPPASAARPTDPQGHLRGAGQL